MAGSWPHLAARFFDVTAARPLEEHERRQVAQLLRPGPETLAFWSQPPADQRHGWEAAQHVAVRAPQRPELIRAALLHDIGKRHAGLGVVGRVAATLAQRLRLPLRGRWELYHRHGEVAAAELEEWGAEALVVEYARHHHQPRPNGVAAEDWRLLGEADRARLRRRGR